MVKIEILFIWELTEPSTIIVWLVHYSFIYQLHINQEQSETILYNGKRINEFIVTKQRD